MPPSEPLVSVLVTVYNRAPYLRVTLDSILASSMRDFEVIVVDDCSKDDSLNIARAMAAKDSRIKVFANEKNLGDYGNRMKVASLARGQYLKYVDSDDLVYPHTLQVMFDAMEANPDAALALAHSEPDDEQPFPWRLTPAEAWRKHFLGRGCLSCGPTGAIIRRAAFDEVSGFRRDWRVLSDIDLWLRLSARWPVVLLPPGLVWWRRHDGQEYSRQNADLYYLEHGFRLGNDAVSGSYCPLSPADAAQAKRKLKQHHARRLISLASRRASPLVAWRLFRSSQISIMDLLRGLQRYE